MNQKEEFSVGDKEKHTVSFTISFWSGGFSVFIDGNKTDINGVSWLSGPFTVEVGEKEKHTVTFQIIIAAPFAAFRKKKVQVLVDNKLFKTF